MLFLADTSHILCPFYQITAKGINPKACDLIYKITAAFPCVEPVHLIRVVSDIDIGFVVPVIDSTVAAADILRNRYTDIKDALSVRLIFDRREVERRVHLVFIINGCHKFLFDLIDLVLLDAENFSVVLHTEKDVAAVAIRKSADGLVDVLHIFVNQ